MWNEFNMCWVCLMRKQKELLQEGILATELHPPRDLLPPETLRRMGDELIRLCDSLERHGLVDYQLGVWEEEIIDGTYNSNCLVCSKSILGNGSSSIKEECIHM